MCLLDAASVDHVLNCKVAKFLWELGLSWFGCLWGVPNSLYFKLGEWPWTRRLMWKASFIAIIWAIWKGCIACCFEGKVSHSAALVDKAKIHGFMGNYPSSVSGYFCI